MDITGEKLKLAAGLGADIVIDARSQDPAEVLRKHIGADVAIGPAVDERSFATAYAGLRRGRVVPVALPAAGTMRIPVFDTMLNETSVIGSIVSTCADLRRTAGPDDGRVASGGRRFARGQTGLSRESPVRCAART